MAGRFDGPMSREPNVVLRGGQLDGLRVRAHNRKPLTLMAGELLFVYRPLGEMDSEHPELAVYVYSHTEDR